MDEILAHLQQSIADEHFSKEEKRALRDLVSGQNLNADQLNFLSSKMYELASEKATEKNIKFIIEWIRQGNNALTPKLQEFTEAFFSPGESCRATIIQQIGKATRQLKICVFTISDDRITDSILLSHKRGVDIKILTDNDKSLDIGSDIDRLAREGIKIKMDNTSNHMHHKFMITDERMMLTGSYNWTQSAARFNHENIVLNSEAGVVKSFLNQFDKLWKEMDDYK